MYNMSNSRSQYSEKGNGNRYDPKTGKEVTSTQLPAHRSRTEGSQTGTDEVKFDIDSVTSEDRNKQKVRLEEIERRNQAKQQHGQSLNNGTVSIRSASTEFRENPNPATSGLQQPNSNDSNYTGLGHNQSGAPRARAGQTRSNESTGPGHMDKSKNLVTPKKLKKPPPTKINIKSGRGSCIVASKSTLANANINVESSSGENVIMGFNGPNDFDVVSGDGRIQKAAGGDYHHTPASQLDDRRIDSGANDLLNQQDRNAAIVHQDSGNSNEQGYLHGQHPETFRTGW